MSQCEAQSDADTVWLCRFGSSVKWSLYSAEAKQACHTFETYILHEYCLPHSPAAGVVVCNPYAWGDYTTSNGLFGQCMAPRTTACS